MRIPSWAALRLKDGCEMVDLAQILNVKTARAVVRRMLEEGEKSAELNEALSILIKHNILPPMEWPTFCEKLEKEKLDRFREWISRTYRNLPT